MLALPQRRVASHSVHFSIACFVYKELALNEPESIASCLLAEASLTQPPPCFLIRPLFTLYQ